MRHTLVLLLSVVLMAGCGSREDRIDEDTRSAAELYAEAKSSLDRSNWSRAINQYKFLQARYPFGRYTEQAQLELAFAYFKNFEPELASSTLERFLKTYPSHPNADYAQYLKGLINFSRERGFTERLLPETTSGRDPNFARQAFFDFATLLREYPNSAYAPDARSRMLVLREDLAGYELDIARYYLRRGAFVGAAQRATYILQTFENSALKADALAVLAEAYSELELDLLAEDATRVLELNAPEHPYLTGKRQRKGFFSRFWPF